MVSVMHIGNGYVVCTSVGWFFEFVIASCSKVMKKFTIK
jgi:hypothetical protein